MLVITSNAMILYIFSIIIAVALAGYLCITKIDYKTPKKKAKNTKNSTAKKKTSTKKSTKK